MNSEEPEILVESILSRLDELIVEMSDDRSDTFYSAMEYAQQLREELQNILDSL
jgi:hypothetical protein